jgi:hypothetical protein
VKAEQRYCSCLEWQHTGKPCQHGLVVIIAQQMREVGMEHFVDEYFSVDKFKKAYTRSIENVGDKSFWPHVDIAYAVNAPIGKRSVGRQRKNQMKSCLEGGAAKKKHSVPVEEKEKKILRGKIKCPNCGQLGHRKASPKCPLNGSKKRQAIYNELQLHLPYCYFIVFFCVFQETETSEKHH